MMPETTSFLFHGCTAQIDARGSLIVTLPAEGLSWRGALASESARGIEWYDPEPLWSGHLVVPCEPGSPSSYDGVHDAEPQIQGQTCTFEFTGAVHYGRVPTDHGWALHVICAPRRRNPQGSIWRWYAAVEIAQRRHMVRSPVRRAAPAGESFIEHFHRALSAGATVAQAIRKAKTSLCAHSVLVVDDDEDARNTLAECLRGEGYDVQSAADGRTALAALRLGLRPAIIFLDLMMPVFSGLEVLAALRSSPQWRSIPVVVVTAQEQILANVKPVLRKPASAEALLRAAREATCAQTR